MKYKCPECGGRLVPILYGDPTYEAGEAAKRKELYLGGCCVNPLFQYHCYNCNKDFGEFEFFLAREQKSLIKL